jgi:hypothetical protein
VSDACERQVEVTRAAAQDRWTAGLTAHIEDCRDCAAAAAVAPWMDRFARISDREHILPDPSLVWLKAQLLRGSVDASRAARPLNFAQLTAYVLVAGGWAALLTWKWAAIEAWLRGFTPAGLVSAAAGVESLSLSLFASLVALASITVMLALHTVLAED